MGVGRKSGAISPIMRRLSAYIAEVPHRPLSAAVTERAKHHLLDTLAAMLSGSRLLPGRRAIEFAAVQGGAREACVIGSRIVTSAVTAALANGMHGHSDETDDTYYLALVHPGCSIVPAALAMAERNHAGGTALLRAMVLGYDVCARMSKALGLESFRSAGHSTHSFGGLFGSAAAAGAIARLNADQARYLLSYTAQQASGLSCWARDIEHIEKAFDFGGMPARNGVTAAVMAAMRFTGVEDVFSGDRNFFQVYGRFGRPERLVNRLGREFEIMNTAIKRWPVGYPIQAPLDAVSNLIAAHGVQARDVERVVITIDEQGARTVNQRKVSRGHERGGFSARAAGAGEETQRAQGSAAFLKTERTQEIVEIRGGGARLRHHTTAVRGTATNPMPRDEVAAKSRDLLVPVIGPRRTERLINAVWNIERIRDACQLRPLLQV